MLPLRADGVVGGGRAALASLSRASGLTTSGWLARYIRRGLSPAQLDLEYLGAQLGFAVTAPVRLYKLTQMRKQTKGSWARDDAGFAFLLLLALAVLAVVWGAVYRLASVSSYLWLIATAWAQLLVLGGALASACCAYANSALRAPVPLPAREQRVEWLFAWDVSCNSFVPVLLCLHVGLLLTAPISLAPSWTGALLGNGLLAVASALYWYGTFRGYLILPFLQRANVFLAPAMATLLLLLLATALGFNAARFVVGLCIG